LINDAVLRTAERSRPMFCEAKQDKAKLFILLDYFNHVLQAMAVQSNSSYRKAKQRFLSY
jgi:hypothetical protein